MIAIIDFHCDAMLPAGLKEAGGGNVYSKNILDNVCGAGHNIIYITEHRYDNYPIYEKINDNCEVYRIKKQDMNEQYILKILDKYVISVIHSIYWKSVEIAIAISKKYNIPFIYSPISNYRKKIEQNLDEKFDKNRDAIENLGFEHARYIVCGSLQESNEIERLYQVKKEKLLISGLLVSKTFENLEYDLYGNRFINTNNSCIKINSFPIVPIYQNEILILSQKVFTYFGRLHKDKGIIQILTAWKNLYDIMQNKTPALWLIGGSLDDILYFHREIKSEFSWIIEAEREQKIVWWGSLSHESISLLLTKSLATVSHSCYETSGTFVIESLAHGVPVIATPFGYGKDYIYDYFNGFIVPFNDIDKLTIRLYQLAIQPFLSQIMGENCLLSYKKINEQYNFLNTHLFAYGLSSKTEDRQPIKFPCQQLYSLNGKVINSYPCNSSNFKEEIVVDWIKKYCTAIIGNIEKIEKFKNDYILTTATAEKKYIAKKINLRLNIDAIFDEKSNNTLVYDINNQLYSLQLLEEYGELFKTIIINSHIGIYVAEINSNCQSSLVTIPAEKACVNQYVNNLINGLMSWSKILKQQEYYITLKNLKRQYKMLEHIDQNLPAIIIDKQKKLTCYSITYDVELLDILPIMIAVNKNLLSQHEINDLKKNIGEKNYNKLLEIYKNIFEIKDNIIKIIN